MPLAFHRLSTLGRSLLVGVLVTPFGCGLAERGNDVVQPDVPIGTAAGFVPDDARAVLRSGEEPDVATAGLRRVSRIRLADGWARGEPWGRWAQGDHATVLALLPADEPVRRTLRATCRPLESPDGTRQTVRVVVNDVPIGAWVLQGQWADYALEIPASALGSGANRIRFEFGYSLAPADLGVNDDTRELAVGFSALALITAEAEAGERDGDPAGTLFVPVDASMGGGALVVDAGSTAKRPLTFEGLSGAVVELARGPGEVSVSLPAMQDAAPGCWVVPMAAAPHELSASRGDVDRPADPAQARRAGSRRQAQAAGSRPLPDIVVLLPDAARADHFGCYGYATSTTPHVDTLAEDALVFRHAYALAPYTLNSVATMLTGTSWLDHRVEVRGQALSRGWTTLAEYLRAAGYRTIVYSANPNHSPATGADQGVDEFLPLWESLGRSERLDPIRLANLAIERIGRGFGGQPFFMMLHMVPPHEPYTPPPKFDVFGDPGYGGTIDGSQATIAGIDSGEIRPSPADLRRLVSLYDGNLRTVDAAIGRVLAALRARSRWDRTAVLVVSDHGEAFGEHGRMGHNSTVHREMLHVPFILRLPETLGAPKVDTAAMVSLADLAPTLLSLAGVRPGPEVTGVDLLSSGADRDERLLVARSAVEPPDYAIWNAKWKLITDHDASSAIFDLEADPAERIGAAVSAPRKLFCLERLLDLELACRPPARDGADRQLTEDESETLRSLGYAQ